MNVFSGLINRFFGLKKAKIVMLGLDDSGKTTILYRIKDGELKVTEPTISFNLETFGYKGIEYTVWDIGGTVTRPLWKHYFTEVQAVVFVVDCSTTLRMAEVITEFQAILRQEEVCDVPLLILANKQDLPGAISSSELSEHLALESQLSNRCWKVFPTTVLEGETLYDALDWLHEQLSEVQEKQQ